MTKQAWEAYDGPDRGFQGLAKFVEQVRCIAVLPQGVGELGKGGMLKLHVVDSRSLR